MPVVRLASLIVLVLAASCAGSREGRSRCSPECGAFQQCCMGDDGSYACVRISDNPNHCGGCGIRCPSGRCMSSMCIGGSDDGGPPTGDCRPTCSSAQRCCGTTCVNRSVTPGTDGRTDSSFMHCNGCGLACDPERASACSTPAGMSGPPRCLCGNFPQCSGSDVCVASSTGTFQCVNLSTNPDNCGEVGHECAEGEICSGGECVCGSTGGSCSEGQACCGGSCIDITSDPENCGGCGNVCGEQGTSCQDGTCRCGDGPGCRAPAGSDLGELCCADTCVPQDAANCGGCGMACASGEMCVYGTTLTGTMEICCSPVVLPGFPSFCFGGGFGDGGFPFDASFPFDGGFPFDAGFPFDGGFPVDASFPFDAGVAHGG